MSEQKPNPENVKLTVTKSQVTTKDEKDDLAAEMEAELKEKFNEVAIDQLVAIPQISSYIQKLSPFLPLIVGKGKKFFGKDEKRIMCYLDEETDAFVIEIIDTANIASFEYKEEPKSDNFFIVQKKDLDNPMDFIKMMMAKSNLNLF